MALEDLSSVLGVPENYASPQQLAMARQLAQALMKPQGGQFMQSWTQPASQIVNALVGAKYMQQANAAERANAGAGLPMPGGSPLGQAGGPGPTGDLGSSFAGDHIGNGLTRITTQSGVPFTVAAEHADKFQGFLNDLEAAGYRINNDPDGGGYNYRNIAGTNKLSEHAYGRAIDINPGVNQPGTPGNIPPDLARGLAEKHGLTWGGDFKHATPDPMHFEVNPNAKVADAGNAPQSPAGAPSQAMVSPPGQGPQPTPGASASPQGAPGAGPPPQLMHQQLITPQMIAQLRYTGNTEMANKLYEMYLQQQQPQTIEWGGVKYMYPGGHPEQATAVPGAPQAHPYEVGKIKGSDYVRLGPNGFEPIPISGAAPGPGSTAPQTASAPASGGYPSQMPSDLSGRIQLEQNMEKQGEQNKADVKEYSSKFNALVGLGADAKDQLPYIQIGKSIVNDPGFYSGTSESSVLGLKRLAVAAGLTNATGATPQEAFRKVMSTMILNQIRTMKESQAAEGGGTQGRIFQQQIQLMEKAAANPDNSPAANRYLLNLFEWSANRNLATANMALDYKMQKGGLDPGFDKMLLNSQDERLNAPESLLFSPEGEGGAPASRGPLESKAALGGPSTSKFQEGQTATNPTTGERRIFKGGTWQKM